MKDLCTFILRVHDALHEFSAKMNRVPLADQCIASRSVSAQSLGSRWCMAEGTQVGAHCVLRQIGEGAKGSLWLAEHATTAIADRGAAGEIGYTVRSGLQRRHPGPGCAPLIRCSRA